MTNAPSMAWRSLLLVEEGQDGHDGHDGHEEWLVVWTTSWDGNKESWARRDMIFGARCRGDSSLVTTGRKAVVSYV